MRRHFHIWMMLLPLFLGKVEVCGAQTFQHADHTPNSTLIEINGHEMQSVHEYRQVVYVKNGKSVNLRRPDNRTFDRYIRWYDYTTDNALPAANVALPAGAYANFNRGAFYRNTQNELALTYTLPNGISGGQVACDQSNYNDATWAVIGASGSITEPTLSQRLVFDIRPASQMAARVDACVAGTTNWLEEHRMIAPTTNTLYLGPDYDFNSDGFYPNYYYNAANPTSLADATWQWQVNGGAVQTPVVSNGRFVRASSTLPGVVTYTLTAKVGKGRTSTTYQIAKFIVQYYRRDEIGPYAGLNENDRLTNADMLAEQDFNYNRPGRTTMTYYKQPLTVTESSYGFFRSNTHGQNRTEAAGPYWSEYAFVNASNFCNWSQNRRVLYNHGEHGNVQDAIDGYMLYVDGSVHPGEVFLLNMNAELCPGTKMFFSAWVGDLSNPGQSAPNLDFILIGLDDDDSEHVLYTYTTGAFGCNGHDEGGRWLRILCPLVLQDEVDWKSYRLRIRNKGNNAQGNDFVIDDIRIYAQKPPVIPIQASTDPCPGSENSTTTAYLRVDYGAIENTASRYYYQWREGNTVIASNYMCGTDYTNPMAQYGWVDILSDATIAATPALYTVSDFATFDQQYSMTDVPVFKYIREDVGEHQQRWILYIAQPMALRTNYRYTGYVAADAEDLGADTRCGMSADLVIAGGTRVSVDGEVGTEEYDVCESRKYTMALQMSYVVQSGGTLTPIDVHCRADWLQGDSTFIKENESLYMGYAFADIIAAIEAFHAGTATPEQNTMLVNLQTQDLLIMDADSIEVIPMGNDNGILSYTAVPVPGSAVNPDGTPMLDKDGNPLVICNKPRIVQFHLPEPPEDMVMVGAATDILPQYVGNSPRRIRISEATKRSGSIRISVYLKGDQSKTYRVQSALLVKSNYPNWKTVFGNEFRLDVESPAPAVVTNTTPMVVVGGTQTQQLVAGYDYTFVLEMNTTDLHGNLCSNGLTYFTIRIVPDVVVWQPMDKFGAWNNDSNWDTFAPLDSTSVIVTTGEHIIPYPVAHDTMQMVDLEPNAQDYISYDLGYQPYVCKNLYLPTQTVLVNQHLVHINDIAFVDMELANDRWQMLSFPLRGVVSGDIYIPENELSDPFHTKLLSQDLGTAATDRTLNGNPYQVVFSRMAEQIGEGVDISSATWTAPWNAVSAAYEPGYGLSVKLDNHRTGTSILRMPKFNDEYRYYRNGVWVDDYRADITRPVDAGKPGFLPAGTLGEDGQTYNFSNQYYGSKYLIGNPSFAYIDIAKWIESNDSQLTGVYYTLDEDGSYVANIGHISASGKPNVLLKPHSACFVETIRDDYSSIHLTLKPDMLTTSVGDLGGKRMSRVHHSDRQLYISASDSRYTSYAAVVEDVRARDEYDKMEDAEVMLLDGTRTPFTIFTRVDDKALSINQMWNLPRIPLCLYTMQGYPLESIRLQFAGDEDYLREWQLVDGYTRTRYSLSETDNLELDFPQDGRVRYYLEHYVSYDEENIRTTDELHLSYYSMHGDLVVYADADMSGLEIYDAVGRLIVREENPGQIFRIHLPMATYLVRCGGKVVKTMVDDR